MSTNCMIRELKKMSRLGIKEIEIYYVEDMSKPTKDNMWSVDVMCDRLNIPCKLSWSWSVMSAEENEAYKKEYNDNSPLEEYEIVVNEPFSDDVICRAIKTWLIYADLEYLGFEVRMIDFDAASPYSGYVAELLSRNIEEELKTAVPLEDLTDL